MPQCAFYTAKLVRCTRGCAEMYCRTHQPKAAALGPRPEEGHCLCVRRVGGADAWCGQPNREGETLCQWHWARLGNLMAVQQEREARQRLEQQTLEAYLNQDPQQPWPTVARHLRMRSRVLRTNPIFLEADTAYTVARRYFLRTTPNDIPVAVFTNFWNMLWEQEHGIWVAEAVAPEIVPPHAAPLGQMGRLAADTQNVHTAVVAKQTNSNVELLLADGDDPTYDVLVALSSWWMVLLPTTKFADYWKVMEDVKFWYEKRTCKATGDFLYKRVLNGLVSKILLVAEETRELHAELAKRLWEECVEAVGMCCEGHIGRLANVLVGFDEAFRPPVPVGEILQTKMAAIAEMKLSHKLKLQKAVAVMDELKIPVADRAPWLEALEE